jgi:hypothetical protein
MTSRNLPLEARMQGTQESTVRYLTNHHLVAIIVFICAIIAANLWADVIVTAFATVLNVERDKIGFLRSFLLALVFTFITYVLIVYVFKVPITAAFSF